MYQGIEKTEKSVNHSEQSLGAFYLTPEMDLTRIIHKFNGHCMNNPDDKEELIFQFAPLLKTNIFLRDCAMTIVRMK